MCKSESSLANIGSGTAEKERLKGSEDNVVQKASTVVGRLKDEAPPLETSKERGEGGKSPRKTNYRVEKPNPKKNLLFSEL